MKLSISGVEGSDKKSLAEELAKNLTTELINVNFKNVASSYIQMLKSPNAEAAQNARRQHVSASLTWLNELDSKMDTDKGVFLRSPIDLLSLWLKSGVGLQRPDVFVKVLDKCQQQLSKIDFLIVCPSYSFNLSEPFEGQNVPATQETHNKLNYQSLTIGLASQILPNKIIIVPTDLTELNDRLAFVLEAIGNKKISKPKGKKQ